MPGKLSLCLHILLASTLKFMLGHGGNSRVPAFRKDKAQLEYPSRRNHIR